MELTPQIFTAKVMHKRLFPKVNQFIYRVYYVALPLSHTDIPLAHNRFSPLSFYDRDHGAKNNSKPEQWIRDILTQYGCNDSVDEIMLICMPRVLGYVFNPVSFWLCFDKNRQLVAVLSEVNNTFGETHAYLCAHPDQRPILKDDWLATDKVFHVSPFLPREGSYRFRFAIEDDQLGIWIDYYDASGDKQLITALTGQLQPMDKASLRKVFWTHPLVTIKTILLIHYQAMKLFCKGIRYIVKPPQKAERLTHSNLTKR